VVKHTITKRVGAAIAAEAMEDKTPPPPPRELTAFVPVRDRGAGRPTKRERRDIDRLRGRD
jgi:ribosome-associated heat shock protein Hsp15